MSGKDVRVYEDWHEFDAYGNPVDVTQPVSYAKNAPAEFAGNRQVAGEAIAEVLADLPTSAEAAWMDDPGGPEVRLATAQKSLAIFSTLDGWQQHEVATAFEIMPQAVQRAVFTELGLGEPEARRLPTEFETRWFENAVGGDVEATLKNYWGPFYLRRVTKCAARAKRVMRQLSPGGQRQLDDWWSDLTDEQAACAMIALAT